MEGVSPGAEAQAGMTERISPVEIKLLGSDSNSVRLWDALTLSPSPPPFAVLFFPYCFCLFIFSIFPQSASLLSSGGKHGEYFHLPLLPVQ